MGGRRREGGRGWLMGGRRRLVDGKGAEAG